MELFSTARWIWNSEADGPNRYVNFYAPFSLPAEGQGPVLLRISCDSQYAAFVNGEFADANQYADFPEYKVYDQLDVTRLVKPGENLLQLTVYCQVTDGFLCRFWDQGAIFELVQGESVLYASGCHTLSAVNPAYAQGESVDQISPQLRYSFYYDSTRETFLTPRPELAGFTPSVEKPGAERYYPRPIAKLENLPPREGLLQAQGVFSEPAGADTIGQRMQYAALSFREPEKMNGTVERLSIPSAQGLSFQAEEGDGDGLFLLFDLREEDEGYLTLDIDLPREADILLGWGEHLDDLRVRSYVGTRNYAALYHARAGRQQFTHYLKRAGLRYVQLHIHCHQAVVYYAGLRPTRYPLSHRPEFHCADQLHNRIYQVSKRTLQTCMHEHYEDCPLREQALYAMDSRNQMLCGYYAFGEYDFPKASLRLLAHSLREDRFLELIAPGDCGRTIPSFSAMYLVELYEYLLFSGDQAFVREVLPYARQVAEGFADRIQTQGPAAGLIAAICPTPPYWNFYEWQPQMDGESVDPRMDTEAERYDAPLNCFVSLAFQGMGNIFDILGEPAEAQQYFRLAREMNQGVDRYFWTGEGVYAAYRNSRHTWCYTELTQSLAVCCGACPEEKLDGLLEAMRRGQGRTADSRLTPSTLSHTVFKYDAYMKRPEKYSRFVFDEIARQWGDMLYQGATTFWETEKGGWDFANAGSLCHGWSAIPVYVYFAYGLGLRPTQPGFAQYALRPVDSGLYERSGRFVTSDSREIEL